MSGASSRRITFKFDADKISKSSDKDTIVDLYLQRRLIDFLPCIYLRHQWILDNWVDHFAARNIPWAVQRDELSNRECYILWKEDILIEKPKIKKMPLINPATLDSESVLWASKLSGKLRPY